MEVVMRHAMQCKCVRGVTLIWILLNCYNHTRSRITIRCFPHRDRFNRQNVINVKTVRLMAHLTKGLPPTAFGIHTIAIWHVNCNLTDIEYYGCCYTVRKFALSNVIPNFFQLVRSCNCWNSRRVAKGIFKALFGHRYKSEICVLSLIEVTW